MNTVNLLIAIVLLFISNVSFATCSGIVTRTTTETETNGIEKTCQKLRDVKNKEIVVCPSSYQRGTQLTEITQYYENKKTNNPVFCIKGSGCYQSRDIQTSTVCSLSFFKE